MVKDCSENLPPPAGWRRTRLIPVAAVASLRLTCSSFCPTSWRAGGEREAEPVCWCSLQGKKPGDQLDTQGPRGLTTELVQVHRCSGRRPGHPFPPRPGGPSPLHYRSRHRLCGPPGLLHGAQVRLGARVTHRGSYRTRVEAFFSKIHTLIGGGLSRRCSVRHQSSSSRPAGSM